MPKHPTSKKSPDMSTAKRNRYGPPINVRHEDLRSDPDALRAMLAEVKRSTKRKRLPTLTDVQRVQSRLERQFQDQQLYQSARQNRRSS